MKICEFLRHLPNTSLLTLLLYTAFPAWAWSQSAELPTVVDFSDGDHWEWRQTDNLTKLEQLRFGRTAKIIADIPQFRRRGALYSLEQEFVTSERGKTVNPLKPWRVWPLAIEKTWDYETSYTNSDGLPIRLTQSARVVSYEEVEVPAGKFMAFKIEYKGIWTMTNYAHNMFSGKRTDTYWYAPEARADVKHELIVGGVAPAMSTEELMRYVRPTR